MNKQTAHIKR